MRILREKVLETASCGQSEGFLMFNLLGRAFVALKRQALLYFLVTGQT
jgi:hypothetical protein